MRWKKENNVSSVDSMVVREGGREEGEDEGGVEIDVFIFTCLRFCLN